MSARRTESLALWLTAASVVGALAALILGVPWALREADQSVEERRENLHTDLRRAAAEVAVRFTSWHQDTDSFLERPPGFVVTPVRHQSTPPPTPGASCRALLRKVGPGTDGVALLQVARADESFTTDERAMLTRALVRCLPENTPASETIALLEEASAWPGLSAEILLLLAFDRARRNLPDRHALLADLLPEDPGRDSRFEKVSPGRRAMLCRQLLPNEDPRRHGNSLRALEFLDRAAMAEQGAGTPVVATEDGQWLAWVHASEAGRFEVAQGPSESFFAFFSPDVAAGRFAVDPTAGDAALAAPLPPWFLKPGPTSERELVRLLATGRLLRLSMIGALALLLGAVGFLSWRALRRERVLEHHKTNFVTAVTHELKTPLATIALCAETLRDHGATDPEAIPRFSRMILDETERLGLRIQQILDVAAGRKLMEQATSQFDPAGVIEAVVAEVRPGAAEQGVQIELRLADEHPHVKGSADLLAQAFNGILENAIQFGGPGVVHVRATVGGEHYVVAVADQGPGLSSEQRKRVFEPFIRLQPEMTRTVPGTGLGLTLARQCVQALGGEVLARPRKPGGTVFLIRLPLQNGGLRE